MNMQDLCLNRVPTVEEVEARRASRDAQLKSFKAKAKAKKTWSYEQTLELINLMGQDGVQRKMEGMVHNSKIWRDIAATLGTHSAEQCHDKWAYLKRRYREVSKNNNKSGRGRQSFTFYDEVDGVLGHRPMSSIENHSHLDSSSLSVEGHESSSESEPEGDDTADDDNNSFIAESSVDGIEDEIDPTSQQDPQPPTSKQPAKKPCIRGAGKVKRSRGVSGALDKAMTELIRLQDRMDEREENRLRAAEEREDKRMQDEQQAEERRRRWEQEQEDRRAREHREFMLQMVQMMRQPPMYPTSYPNNNWNGNGGGPSYTSL